MAKANGFSLHAGVSCEGKQKDKRERLWMCESGVPKLQDHCEHYIMGVFDALETQEDWLQIGGLCKPLGVGSRQLEKVVIKGLNERPEVLHLRAASLIMNVIQDTFPCD